MNRARNLVLTATTLALLASVLLLVGCTTVNITTSANVGANKAAAKVTGSAWAEVSAGSMASTETAYSYAGRAHPVSGEAVGGATLLGAIAIGAGAGGALGGVPGAVMGGGAGALAADALTSDTGGK